MEQTASRSQDVELVSRIRDGDARAETLLHDKYQPRIYYLIKNAIPSKEEAEEVCQEVFRAVLEAARQEKIREPEKLFSFIYRVGSYKIKDWIKAKQKRERFEDDGPTANTEDELINQEKRKRLKNAWQKLNLEAKRLLYLLYVRGWSSKEVGEYFGISHEAVRKRAQHYKNKIRKEFAKGQKAGHKIFGLTTLMLESLDKLLFMKL